MAGQKHTESELDLLTDEEREGLLENIDEPDDDDDGTGDAAAAVAAETEAKPEADLAAAKAAEEQAAFAAAAAAKAAALAPTAVTPPVVTPPVVTEPTASDEDAVVDFLPEGHRVPSFQAPGDATEKLSGIEKQIDELAQKFDDGDLTSTEYRQKVRTLENERGELHKAQIKAEMSHDIVVDSWSNVAVPAFMDKNPQYKSGFLYNALDAEVRRLQAEAANPFDPIIFARAHKAIDAQIRAVTGQAAATPAAPKPKAAADPAGKRTIPPTLAHVPAADISDVENDGSQYAYLDRLAEADPLAYEDASLASSRKPSATDTLQFELKKGRWG